VIDDLDDESDIDNSPEIPILQTINIDLILELVLQKTQPSVLGLYFLEYILHAIKIANRLNWNDMKSIYSAATYKEIAEMSAENQRIRSMLSYLKIVD
jgi:hypothetical protein